MSHQYVAWFFITDMHSPQEAQTVENRVSDIYRNEASWSEHHYCEFSARHGWHIYLLMAVAAAYEIAGLEFMFEENYTIGEIWLGKPELLKAHKALDQVMALVRETIPPLRQYESTTVDQFWRPASYSEDFKGAKPYVGKLWFEESGMNDIQYWGTFLTSFHSAVEKALSEDKFLGYLVAPHPPRLFPSSSA
jgi:hypothetical protein